MTILFTHFYCVCPLGFTIKLTFNVSKVAYSVNIFQDEHQGQCADNRYICKKEISDQRTKTSRLLLLLIAKYYMYCCSINEEPFSFFVPFIGFFYTR